MEEKEEEKVEGGTFEIQDTEVTPSSEIKN